VAEAVLFYRYVGELSDEFLEQHVFSRQEVLDGLRNLAENAGLLGIVEMMMHDRRGGS
jgi:chromosome condensin MukBEF MukE localization factor